jgi:hypothetical protein
MVAGTAPHSSVNLTLEKLLHMLYQVGDDLGDGPFVGSAGSAMAAWGHNAARTYARADPRLRAGLANQMRPSDVPLPRTEAERSLCPLGPGPPCGLQGYTLSHWRAIPLTGELLRLQVLKTPLGSKRDAGGCLNMPESPHWSAFSLELACNSLIK